MDDLPTPCPFCHSARTRVVEFDYSRWAMMCEQCDATGPTALSPEKAIERWRQAPVVFEHSSNEAA